MQDATLDADIPYGPHRFESKCSHGTGDLIQSVLTLILDKRRRFDFTLDPSACTITICKYGQRARAPEEDDCRCVLACWSKERASTRNDD